MSRDTPIAICHANARVSPVHAQASAEAAWRLREADLSGGRGSLKDSKFDPGDYSRAHTRQKCTKLQFEDLQRSHSPGRVIDGAEH